MDFNDSPEEAAYRKKAQDFLKANATLTADAPKRAADRPEAEALVDAKAWQKKKMENGFARLPGPKSGAGLAGRQCSR